jgi:hypothetical protein
MRRLPIEDQGNGVRRCPIAVMVPPRAHRATPDMRRNQEEAPVKGNDARDELREPPRCSARSATDEAPETDWGCGWAPVLAPVLAPVPEDTFPVPELPVEDTEAPWVGPDDASPRVALATSDWEAPGPPVALRQDRETAPGSD